MKKIKEEKLVEDDNNLIILSECEDGFVLDVMDKKTGTIRMWQFGKSLPFIKKCTT